MDLNMTSTTGPDLGPMTSTSVPTPMTSGDLAPAGVDLNCPRFDKEDMVFLINFSFWVEGVLQTGLATLGILGNFVSIFVLTRKSMRNAFNLLLVTLAAFDTWYLFGAILESFRKTFDLASSWHILLFPYFLYPLHQASMSGSVFMTVAIALERYAAVHYPVNYNQVIQQLIRKFIM